MALVGSGAINNFIAESCVVDLRLKLAPSSIQIKKANVEVQQIRGSSIIGLKVGDWTCNFGFSIDDFD